MTSTYLASRQKPECRGAGHETVVVGLILRGPKYVVLEMLVLPSLPQLIHVGVLAAVAVTHLCWLASVNMADVVVQNAVEGQAEGHRDWLEFGKRK